MPVCTALHVQGFDVRGAADGDHLGSMLGTFTPNLVILDVMLPGRDGFALLGVVQGASRAALPGTHLRAVDQAG